MRLAGPDGVRFPTTFPGLAYPISGSAIDILSLQASRFLSLSLRHSEIKSQSHREEQRGFKDFKGPGVIPFLPSLPFLSFLFFLFL